MLICYDYQTKNQGFRLYHIASNRLPRKCPSQAELASKVKLAKGKGPRRVLVIGASTGYGLASRISAAFANNADTLGVSFEREPKEGKPGSPGHYNISAFRKLAAENNLIAEDINGDAFSDACKDEVVKKAKEMGGDFDLVIYSLASPRQNRSD